VEEQLDALMKILVEVRRVPGLEAPLLKYVDDTYQVDRAAIVQAVRLLAPGMEGLMATIASEYRQEGREQGKAEGKAEGRAEGKAEALVRLMERRFGTLDELSRRLIAEATQEKLDRWLLRVLDAEDAGAVLG
jgi:hypothetical protein